MLNDNQKKLLAYIKNFIAEHGESPTIQEMANGLDASKGTAYGALQALVRKKFISQKSAGTYRGIKVIKH